MGQVVEVPDDRYGQQTIRTWEPTDQSRAHIVLVHGLAEHSGRYEQTAQLLAKAGFTVTAPDLFGFGMSGGPRGDVQNWSHYWDQVERLITNADGSVILMGHSMGGLICAGYLLNSRRQPSYAILSAPAIGGGAWWQRAFAPILARLSPKAMVPNNLDGAQLSRDPEVGVAYFADPLVYTKSSARLGAAIFAAQDFVSDHLDSWEVETLVLHGGSDTIVPPVSTVGLGELSAVARRLYPKLRHEIFNEPEGPELVGEVVDWINEHLDG